MDNMLHFCKSGLFALTWGGGVLVNTSAFVGFDETCRNGNGVALPLLFTEYGASISYL